MTSGRIPMGSGVAAPGSAVVPALADGVELISQSQGSGYRIPPALVRRADGQVIQLTQLLHLVLSAIDGLRTTGEIAAKVSMGYGKTVSDVLILGANARPNIYRVQTSMDMKKDITDGLVKSMVFAVIVSTVCCYQGYFTHMRTDSQAPGGRDRHHIRRRRLLRADFGVGLCSDIPSHLRIAPMESRLIEFKDVTKRFGWDVVLYQVNLQIFEGQVTTIIGLSGSGKSVLLKHIIGLVEPDEGMILFHGKPFSEMKKSESAAKLARISYMFQDNALFDSMTVYENIALPLR